MALVNKIEKKVKMNKDEVIKYQILTHCFLNDIQISMSDLNCLHVLSLAGKPLLNDFCKTISDAGIFKSAQSARNALSKSEKKGLIIKDANNKKKILINPNMDLEIEGTILLDYKILGFES